MLLGGAEALEQERSFVSAAEIGEPGVGGVVLGPAESREDPACLKRKFTEICNPQNNKTVERHMFHSPNQKQVQTVESIQQRFKDKRLTKKKSVRRQMSRFWPAMPQLQKMEPLEKMLQVHFRRAKN